MRRWNKKALRGFTLLEAMVAIVVLASSSLALYSWYGTSLNALEKANNISEHSLLMGDLDAFLSTLNLQGETQQQFQINDYTIRLQATLIEPFQESRTGVGALGLYRMGLYRVVLNVTQDKRAVGEFETRLVGYTKVRQ